MLNIVIPIAGRGSRFVEAGYLLPKPLIPVYEMPMIEVVVNNIRPKTHHSFTFIALKEHLDNLEMSKTLERIAPGCNIISVNHVTEGAACTVLLAKEVINNEDPLMLANSDQWIDIDINDYLKVMERKDIDGLIMTMSADHPKWSYIGINKDRLIDRVVEKQVISNEATVGIYNFKHGSDFILAAEQMISKNLRVNNEFYVAPVYNEMIGGGAKITYYNIGQDGNGMYGLGVPSDLTSFLQNPISRKILSNRIFDGQN
jgi:dTDP-glucose pyrophosphorylase